MQISCSLYDCVHPRDLRHWRTSHRCAGLCARACHPLSCPSGTPLQHRRQRAAEAERLGLRSACATMNNKRPRRGLLVFRSKTSLYTKLTSTYHGLISSCSFNNKIHEFNAPSAHVCSAVARASLSSRHASVRTKARASHGKTHAPVPLQSWLLTAKYSPCVRL